MPVVPSVACPGSRADPAGVRYLGSKARIAPAILDIAGAPTAEAGTFVDVFAGTGTVSRAAAQRGWRVRANDYLASASTLTRAQLSSAADVPFEYFGGYAAALRALDATAPREGFIFREYSPSGRSRSGHDRLYFTCHNAGRIDGMRGVIESWWANGAITDQEKQLLLADLLQAANTVANTAGTYGCFLRRWSNNALKPIALQGRLLLSHCVAKVSSIDAFNVETVPSDLVYLDPPYTKRQYAAYYHVMETIAFGDEPVVGGVTGLREWIHKSSPFCYKRKALDAILSLVSASRARRHLVSYSSEGHVPLDALVEALAAVGSVTIHRVSDIGRYRPNSRASFQARDVTEFVVEVTR